MLFVSFYTLGCKLNQLESESLADRFCGRGCTVRSWGALSGGEGCPQAEGGAVRDCAGRADGDHTDSVDCGDRADLYVINTCTVTSKAEQKARRMIRKVLREIPDAVVIVTGCYAELDKPEIEALEAGSQGRLFVVPGSLKSSLLDLPAFLAGEGGPEASPRIRELVALWFSRCMNAPLNHDMRAFPVNQKNLSSRLPGGSDPFGFVPSRFSFHTRAFLKIQDGCDKRCSYCRVSLARGRSRSLEAAEVLERVKRLEVQGYAEAVLTGVNISRYRGVPPEHGDTAPSLTYPPDTPAPQYRQNPTDIQDLAYLLKYLLSGTDRIKLRLSSIEPDAIGERLLEALASPRIQPHFHLSVQSGSPLILERMRRSYSPEDITLKIGRLRSVKDDPFIACDIITGFPGETQAEFEKTYALCKEAGFAWIHAFPYSPRQGTEAMGFKGKVSEREARARMTRLTDLAWAGRLAYIGRWLGREVGAVIEDTIKTDGIEEGKPYTAGLSDNYLKLLVYTNGKPPPRGSALRCRLSALPHGQSSRFDAAAEIESGFLFR